MRSIPHTLFLLVFLGIPLCIQAQVLRGRILDNITQLPVGKGQIIENHSGLKSEIDEHGNFELNGSALYEILDIQIVADHYKTYAILLNKSDWNESVQEFYLFPEADLEESSTENPDPLNDEDQSEGDVYSLLSSSDDPLFRAVGFEWSPFRFRLRGVPGTFDQMGFNGFLLNDLTTGRIPFQLFSGQSVLTRYSDDTYAYGTNTFEFGSAGLTEWITANPEAFRKELSVSLAQSNRNFSNKAGIHYASGLQPSGFTLVAGANRRWAQEAYVPGTFYDAWGAYLGISKSFNSQHSLSLWAVYAPVWRGKSSPGVKEVFELADDPYYNSYWGYQQGKKRNSREAYTSSPAAFLNYNFRISDKLRYTAGLMAMYSSRYDSQLDWSNGPDPRPDYYQKLPSYIEDSTTRASVTEAWKTNPSVSQLDWNSFYQANYNNQRTIASANGDSAQLITGKQAIYWISKRFVKNDEIEHFGNLNWLNKRHELNLNYRYEHSKTDNFLEVGDLLGADFVLDIEDFISNPDLQHPDIRRKNHVVRKGEKYGYHYLNTNDVFRVGVNYNYIGTRFDANASVQYISNRFFREGKIENGIFSNSFGTSGVFQQGGLGISVSGTWKLNGRNYIRFKGARQELPNRFDQVFVNPEWRAFELNAPKQTKIASADLAYFYKAPRFKFYAGVYGMELKDQIVNKNFYLDEQLESASNQELSDGGLISAFYTGLNERHLGFEASMELNLGYGWSCTAAYSGGDHVYTSRPDLLIYDKFSTAVSSHTIYFKNFYVYGSPQIAANLGIRYDLKSRGFLILNANYLDRQYLEPNPLRRIPQAVNDLDPAEPLYQKIINQEKLPHIVYLNLFAYKPFKLFKQDFTASLSVNNLLNSRDLISNGFEQFRFDYTNRDVDLFPPKYYYVQGINYYLSLTWRL